MSKRIPRMVDRVLSNAYRVKPGDNVVKITAGLVGCGCHYPELVGANLHKQLTDAPDLDSRVFASLVPDETLNLPASWLAKMSAGGAVGSVPTDTQISQITALGDVVSVFLTTGETAGAWVTPGYGSITQIGQVMAAWWPYLNDAPNSLGLPPLDANALNILTQWIGLPGPVNQQNTSIIANLMIAAKNYWDAVGAIPYLPWNAVPWQDWITHFPQFMVALGNNPNAVLEILQFLATIVKIPANTGGSGWIQSGGGIHALVLQKKVYQPPNFTTNNWTDWANHGGKQLMVWNDSGAIDPAAVPWDVLLTDPTVAPCILAHPELIAQMKADMVCWQNPGTCDPMTQFKTFICSGSYMPGWCNQPPCKQSSGGCTPKTCVQLGKTCGVQADGCGGVVDCGSCPVPGLCPVGKHMVNGVCVNENIACADDGKPCDPNTPCCGDETCVDGKCAKPAAAASSNTLTYVGIGIGALAVVGIGAVLLGGGSGGAPRANPGRRNPSCGCSKRNPIQSRVMRWHRDQFPDGIEIINMMAETAWTDYWAREQEEKGRSFSGQEIMGQAPRTPAKAKDWAVGLAMRIGCNNPQLPGSANDPYWIMHSAFKAAVEAGGKDDTREFGFTIAMQAMGHGVAWTDDNPDFGLKVPYNEFYG